MEHSGLLRDLLVLLLAPVVVVPVFRRLRSIPILGYLAAGILVGPYALGLVGDPESVAVLAELGVAFLMFAIGLELSLERLRVMRRLAFGLGGVQVLLTGTLIGLAARALGADVAAAMVIGGGLALSSTAFVLQLLAERGEQVTRHGRASFAVLLLQDLVVVPMLVLVEALGAGGGAWFTALGVAMGKAALALLAIGVLGRLALRPVFRVVAGTRSPELFVSAALLVVLGTGWLTTQAGLSMALGAFLAGVLLAETEYRHQIEADIRPFRGLLLGLFFITVGLGLDLGVVARQPLELFLVVVALIAAKAVLIVLLGLAFRLPFGDALQVGLLLAPGGEFGFVLFGAAAAVGVLAAPTAELLIAAVAAGMVATPLLAEAGARIARRLDRPPPGNLEGLREETGSLQDHVIIGGFGRVGQTVAKALEGAGVPWVALDLDQARVGRCRAEGRAAFFGDVGRFEVLAAAGAGRARAAVLTIDQPGAVDRAVGALHQHFPELRLFVRGRDLQHRSRLQRLGADAVVPEAVEASLQLGSIVLAAVGTPPEESARIIEALRDDDYAALGPIGTAAGRPAGRG